MFRKILWWRYYFFILLFTTEVKWRQAKNLAPFYTDCKWQSWDLKPGILGPESALGHKPWCHLSPQHPPPPPSHQPGHIHTNKPEWPVFAHTQSTVSWFACVVFSLGKHFFLLFAWTLFNLQTPLTLLSVPWWRFAILLLHRPLPILLLLDSVHKYMWCDAEIIYFSV